MDRPTDGEYATLRRLSDSDLRDVLREISVQSYIRCSRDSYAIENTQNP